MAKLYYAKAHVAVGDSVFRPGEVFDPNVSGEELRRLLKIGAIAECEMPGQARDDPNDPSDDTGGESCADGQKEETGSGEEGVNQADGSNSEEEEASAPAEIDVMDGVSAPKDGQAKPKTSRKSSKRGGDTK